MPNSSDSASGTDTVLIQMSQGVRQLSAAFAAQAPFTHAAPHRYKVLIAEDDLLIADMIEAILITHRYEVCGIAQTVAEAVDLVRERRPDLAIIDLRLADGGLGTEIAPQLGPLDRPGILYATGNASQVVLTTEDGVACLTKPYRSEDLLSGLRIVAEIVATGTTSTPHPRGFEVLRPPATTAAVSHA